MKHDDGTSVWALLHRFCPDEEVLVLSIGLKAGLRQPIKQIHRHGILENREVLECRFGEIVCGGRPLMIILHLTLTVDTLFELPNAFLGRFPRRRRHFGKLKDFRNQFINFDIRLDVSEDSGIECDLVSFHYNVQSGDVVAIRVLFSRLDRR